MIKKTVTDLNLARPNEPLSTVEVDIGSIPEEFFGYRDLLTQAIQRFATRFPAIKVTIYVYHGESVNFHEPSFSAFFGVAGKKKKELLELILNTFRKISGVKVKNSDHIDASMGRSEFHIENGIVWCSSDAITWYSETPQYNDEEKNEAGNNANYQENMNLDKQKIISYPARIRKARSDTTVGVIREKIEELFGLPEGSVALCDPKAKPMRSDTRIETLRKRWNY